MNRIRIALLLTLLCLPGQLAAQVVKEKVQGAELVRSEKRIGPFSFGANEIVVVLDQVNQPTAGGRADTTVSRIRLIDGQGKVHFDEEHEVGLTDDGELWFTREAYPSIIEYSGGQLLSLSEVFYPSAPSSGVTWRLFAWAGDSLRPISGPIDGFGQFVELPKDDTSGRERLHPGDLFYFDAWVYYFAVRVPIEIRPGAAEVEERVRIVAERTDGLAVLSISGAGRYDDSEPASITLYEAPTGSAGRRVLVTPETEVEFGDAYVRLALGFGETNKRVSIDAQLVRLQVRIDGNDGFVDERDLHRMGLRSAG
jgi:hypothetical protein